MATTWARGRRAQPRWLAPLYAVYAVIWTSLFALTLRNGASAQREWLYAVLAMMSVGVSLLAFRQKTAAAVRAAKRDPAPVIDPASLPSPLTVLVDDVRSFRDERPCVVARTSAAAVSLLADLGGHRIDDLWLDHDLGGDDTIWPVVRTLEDAALGNEPVEIGNVHVHASRAGPAHEMVMSLRRLGYAVERAVHPRVFTW